MTNTLLQQKAPELNLMGSDKKMHPLADYKGRKVILYFYPKDNTPGCTLEAEGFRDRNEDLAAQNAVVLGVSKDSLDSHDKFIDKLNLPFVLLSDTEGTAAEAYGVWVEKNMYGKKSMGIQRSTFIIDEEGTVVYENRKVKADGHAEEIQEVLSALK